MKDGVVYVQLPAALLERRSRFKFTSMAIPKMVHYKCFLVYIDTKIGGTIVRIPKDDRADNLHGGNIGASSISNSPATAPERVNMGA